MMLFGEKYGDEVRIITFDSDYSVELCGGTHVQATGELGYFRLLNESSAAAGVRRIEAVVGQAADDLLRNEKRTVNAIKEKIGSNENPSETIQKLLDEQRNLEKEKEQLQRQQGSSALDRLISQSEEIRGGILLIKGEIENADMDLLKQLGYESLERNPKGTVTILGAKDEENGKAYLAAAVTKDLVENKNLKAGDLVGKLGQLLGGGGGGQPGLATAGGSKPEKLDEVLSDAANFINEQMAAQQ